ncbi:MAG: tetratricopeptide repeat protein [Polyangiaceae bacterium]
MKSSSKRALLPVLFGLLSVPALATASFSAWADGKAAKKDDAAPAGGANKPSKEYLKICEGGNAKYAGRDFTGAIDEYRKAIELAPKQALAFYFMGEAQLAAGNLTEADAAWNRASLESNEQDPVVRARVLFVVADLRERQKRWDDAKTAWQLYIDWAAKYPSSNAVTASGQSRQQVIDTMLKQDKAYDVVRERIKATADGGVFTDMAKSPPAAPAPGK